MHCSGHTVENRPQVDVEVRRLWEKIIVKAYDESQSQEDFASRMEPLVADFNTSDIAFPREFLLNKLEQLNFQIRQSYKLRPADGSINWVVLLLEPHVNFAQMYDVYHQVQSPGLIQVFRRFRSLAIKR